MHRLRIAPVLVLATASCVSLADTCPPAGMDREALLQLRARQFQPADPQLTGDLALSLLPCLASPDAELRDGVAFEALAAWMRGKQLTTSIARVILERLLPQIDPGFPAGEGFVKPFSALVLAEVARMDRIEPWLSDAQLDDLLRAAAGYLRSIDDYRGYDERTGWRHGVAHGADLLLQLSLNPRLDADDLRIILDALAAQVAPTAGHFYNYGESARLALPVVFTAQRKLLSDSDWQAWFSRITSPAPMQSWGDAFASQAGLAKRHNTQAFLNALYASLRHSEAAQQVLREQVIGALDKVP